MNGPEGPYLQMALNNAWANATLYDAIFKLPDGAFEAPRPGFFPSLSRTMNHIYEVDLYHLDALEQGGLGRGVFVRDDVPDPADLGRLQAEVDQRLAMFCGKLDAGILAEGRTTERRGGLKVEERVDMLLLNLFQHQVHHRGQAHVQLQDAGVPPPQLDEFFLEFGRAQSAEPYHG
mgnify:CR=1 FL=1